MTNILVVGGAGYIGSHMVLALAEAGHSVKVFDNLSRGHADAVPAGCLVEGDLLSRTDLKRCFATERFDAVMHFAALAYVGESVHSPELYYSNNVTGTLNLLHAMREADVRRFVFSSTCAVYGAVQRIPIGEDEPKVPINPYGRTKLMIEGALQDYGFAYGFASVSLRYFNAAGADPQGRIGERHDPETHLIPLVLGEAMRLRNGGDPAETQLAIYGTDYPTHDGSCVRDYIHVADLCQAHMLAVDRLLAGRVRGAEAYNLANGQGFSVLEVIEVCRAVSGQPVRYLQHPRRVGDPPTLVGDARRAREVLQWEPRFTSLAQIVETAWEWMVRSRTGYPARAA